MCIRDRLQAVDDDHVARREPMCDDAQAIDFGAELDEAVFDAITGGQRQHELLGEVGPHRAILDEDAILILPADETHAREQTRRVAALGVRERGARSDRPGRRVNLVVDEIQLRRMRIAFLVDEPDIDRRGAAGLRCV